MLVYVAFVAGILFLVYKSSNQKIDLVTTDYYAKELKYQQRIDETKRVDSLSESVKYEIKGNKFIVIFPKDFSGKALSGEVVLYCPSDEDKDVKQNFSVLDTTVTVPIHEAYKGFYELHLSWKDGESVIILKKKFNIKM